MTCQRLLEATAGPDGTKVDIYLYSSFSHRNRHVCVLPRRPNANVTRGVDAGTHPVVERRAGGRARCSWDAPQCPTAVGAAPSAVNPKHTSVSRHCQERRPSTLPGRALRPRETDLLDDSVIVSQVCNRPATSPAIRLRRFLTGCASVRAKSAEIQLASPLRWRPRLAIAHIRQAVRTDEPGCLDRRVRRFVITRRERASKDGSGVWSQ